MKLKNNQDELIAVCNFCGAVERARNYFFACDLMGQDLHICNECVHKCVEIMEKHAEDLEEYAVYALKDGSSETGRAPSHRFNKS